MHVCMYVCECFALPLNSPSSLQRECRGDEQVVGRLLAVRERTIRRLTGEQVYMAMYVCMYVQYVCTECMYLAVWELHYEVHIPLRRNEDVVEGVDEHRIHRSLHTYIHTYIHIHTYMYITYIHILIHTLNTYTLHTHMNTYISISVTVIFIAPLHTYIQTCIWSSAISIFINSYIHIYIHAYINLSHPTLT